MKLRDLIRRPGNIADFTAGDGNWDATGMKKIYEPGFIPDGGWQTWELWARDQGKVAAILAGRAANIMSFQLRAKPELTDLQRQLLTWQKTSRFLQVMLDAISDYEAHGYCVIEPVYASSSDGKTATPAARLTVRLRTLNPTSITIYRNTASDIQNLQQNLAETTWRSVAGRCKPGDGDTVIGYVQTTTTNQKIYFGPDELVVILRNRSAQHPDGISLLRQCYTIIMHKLKIDRDQAVMAARHGDPKHIIHIPRSDWDDDGVEGELGRRSIWKKTFSKGIRNGMDFVLPSGEGEDATDISLIEPMGNAAAVIKAQEHYEAMLMEAMGFADSFMQSDSSNRSVGEVQLAFFERSIAPIRRIFSEEIERTILDPLLRWYGYQPGDAWIEYEDLTPDDRLRKAEILAPYISYMPEPVIQQWLQNLGYDTPDGARIDILALSRDHASRRGVAKAVASGTKETRAALKETINKIAGDIEDVLMG